MAALDITTKSSEDGLFEPSVPIVRLSPYKICTTTPPPQHSNLSWEPPAGEAQQTRTELCPWKHPFGYFVSIPGTGLSNKLCYTIGKTNCSILKKAPAVAEVKEEGGTWAKPKGIDAGAQVGSRIIEDDYESGSTTGSEEDDSDGEAWSKYDVLRRRGDEDTLIGEDGDFSMYPDSSDED